MDYLKHLLIRTPVESVAASVRRQWTFFKLRKHPELREVFQEPELMGVLLARVLARDSNCLDVGSHLGSMLVHFLTFAPEGRHVAFEPTPVKARWLRSKFPEVRVEEVAASDVSGEATLFMRKRATGLNSLRPQLGARPLVVRTARVDDLISGRVSLMKIDVEGGELAVMRGAVKTIGRCGPLLLFESTKEGLIAFGVSTDDVFDFLSGHEYSVFLLRDFLEDRAPLSKRSFREAHDYPFKAFNFLAVRARPTACDR
jgi:FkbM family methyltransferase